MCENYRTKSETQKCCFIFKLFLDIFGNFKRQSEGAFNTGRIARCTWNDRV